jgi:hypothetical protein
MLFCPFNTQLRVMLSYCEVTEAPFFYFYFTTGGRPIKLSSGSDHGSFVKVDLVLATLETKHRGFGTGSGCGPGTTPRTQQQQQQHGSHVAVEQRLSSQQNENGNETDNRNCFAPIDENGNETYNRNCFAPIEDVSSRKRNASQNMREEEEESVPLSYRDGFDGYYRDPTQQRTHPPFVTVDPEIRSNSNSSKVDNFRPAKRRLKRLSDTSSDEDDEG